MRYDKPANLAVLLGLEVLDNTDVDPSDHHAVHARNVHDVIRHVLDRGDSLFDGCKPDGVTQFLAKLRCGFCIAKRYLSNDQIFQMKCPDERVDLLKRSSVEQPGVTRCVSVPLAIESLHRRLACGASSMEPAATLSSQTDRPGLGKLKRRRARIRPVLLAHIVPH